MNNYFTFALLILSSLFPFLAFCHPKGQNLIEDTCRTCSTEDPNVNYDFCMASLQAATHNQSTTPYRLGKVSLKLLQYNVTDTRSYAKKLLQKELDPNMKKRLADCFELYDNAIPSVKRAMSLYTSMQFYEANFKVTSVMDAATTCEDGFREADIALSELTKRNSDTFEFGAMVLSIMHMLQQDQN